MRIKKITVMILAFIMVLSMTTMAFAAPYDFTHKTDETKAYSFLDVASTSTVLLDVVSNSNSYLIEGNEGEQYELNAVMALADTGMTFGEAFEELDPYEEPVEEPEGEYLFKAWHFDNVDSNLTIIVEDVETGDDVEYTVLDESGNTVIVNLIDVMEANEGPSDYYSNELAKLDVSGQRMDANDLVRGDEVDLSFVGYNKVEAVEVVEVVNKDHIRVYWNIDGDVSTCSAVENVWFTNETDVAVTVDAFDDDFGTTIVAVGLEGDVATEAAVSYYGQDKSFNGLFTEDGEYEFNAYATNSASDPVTKATESYKLVVDTEDPEVTIDYPTTQTAFEVGVDGNELVAEGTFVEEYITSINAKLWINGVSQWQFDDEESAAVIDKENSEWSYPIDLSDVDFGGNPEATALLEVKAFDCAGNETYEAVEFTLEDTTAPEVVEIVEAGEDWVKVSIEENFKLSNQMDQEAFTVVVNGADFYNPEVMFFDPEEKFVVLWISEPTIEVGHDLVVKYSPEAVDEADRIMDSAGNYAEAKVTQRFNVAELKDATLMVNSQSMLEDALASRADVIELYGEFDGFDLNREVTLTGDATITSKVKLLNGSDSAVIDGLTFDLDDETEMALVVTTATSNVEITNNTFTGGHAGVYVDVLNDALVSNNTFEGLYVEGPISVDTSYDTDGVVTITNNDFSGVEGDVYLHIWNVDETKIDSDVDEENTELNTY